MTKAAQFKRGVLFAKAETTAQTYIDPTAETAIQIEDISVEQVGEWWVSREEDSSPVHVAYKPLTGARSLAFTYTAYLTNWGDTSDATDHPLAAVFRSCPMSVTAGSVDGDDLTYDPTSTYNLGTDPVPVSAVFAAKDATAFAIRGATSVIESIDAEDAGSPIKISMRTEGMWLPDDTVGADSGTLSDTFLEDGDHSITWASVSLDSEPVLLNKGVTLTHGISGTIYGLRGWSFTPGQVMASQPNAGDAEGYTSPFVSHKAMPSLGFQVNHVERSDLDVWAEYLGESSNSVSLAIPTPGTTTDSLTITLPAAYYAPPEMSDADEIRKFDLTAHGISNSGDDQYSIVFSD